MRPSAILHRFVFQGLPHVHKARLHAVACAVEAIVRGGTALPADIGRNIAVDTTPKHGIKRIDRLLGNRHLQSEVVLFYRELARLVLGERPIVLVDWTQLDGEKQVVLVACVAHAGRALPIYQEVHQPRLIGNAAVEAAFLETLATRIVPPECRPIVVTDAGFKNPWFKQVLRWGWDFVGRLVTNVMIRPSCGIGWSRLDGLVSQKVHDAMDLSACALVAKGNPLRGRVLTVRHASKGRKGSKRGTRRGFSESCHNKKKHRRRARQTAVVFTSVLDEEASKIERIYATRMQIEETFRSAKSHRFGWSLEDVRSKSCARLNVLLLLVSLGMLTQILLGALAEGLGLHRQIQANTVKNRRVISLFRLGGFVLARPRMLTRVSGAAWMSFSIRQVREFGCDPPTLWGLSET